MLVRISKLKTENGKRKNQKKGKSDLPDRSPPSGLASQPPEAQP
jgi:hypothetical protein